MVYELNEETATKVLEEIVNDFGPDYRLLNMASGCKYVNEETGKAVCIVGQLFERTGFDMTVFLNIDNNNASISSFVRDNQKDIVIPRKVVAALSNAQTYQDSGSNWQTALEAYKKKLESYNDKEEGWIYQ